MYLPYVIGILRKCDLNGKLLSENSRFYEYFQYDEEGYSCFGSCYSAKGFKTPEDAKRDFNKVKKYLLQRHNKDQYDWSSLAIRRVKFVDFPFKPIDI